MRGGCGDSGMAVNQKRRPKKKTGIYTTSRILAIICKNFSNIFTVLFDTRDHPSIDIPNSLRR